MIAIVVFCNVTLTVFDADPRDLLPMIVCRNVIDLIGDIHVPMDPLHLTARRTAAANVDQHLSLAEGIVFVKAVTVKDFQLRTEKLLGPVAGFTSFRRGAKGVDRGGYRSREFVERN